MESIKELIRGLRGFHLIDGTMGEHVKPSAFRRSIGTLFAILFGLSMSLFLIVSLFLSLTLLISGHWFFAILVPFVAVFAVGIQTIPCWIFIDWEKNRLKR